MTVTDSPSRALSPEGSRNSEHTACGAVITHDLMKTFRRSSKPAVDKLNLFVPRGSVYGFLGPNGSGKTTTIRMLLGLVSPDSGSVEVLGQSVSCRTSDTLHKVGALIEGPAFHPYLSGEANLRRLDAADTGVDPRTSSTRIGHALERVGLTAAAGKTFRTYSLGMKQRLGIAAALLCERELLVLDEPTNGLDPQGTREVRSLILELAAEGVTVLLSTHLLSEVEQVCSHVGVLRAGVLQAQGPLASLRPTPQLRIVTIDTVSTVAVLDRLGIAATVNDSGSVVAAFSAENPQPPDILRSLVNEGIAVREFRIEQPNLEETFIELTGEGFDVSG
ncbi:MAG: ABC transporter ATP-binding protein [Corynebacteriales bacterium]|nr:ABC transporter ATP-binding protein [Mycobacteriales bacterium]